MRITSLVVNLMTSLVISLAASFCFGGAGVIKDHNGCLVLVKTASESVLDGRSIGYDSDREFNQRAQLWKQVTQGQALKTPVTADEKLAYLETIARLQFPGFFADDKTLMPDSPRLQRKLIKRLDIIDVTRVSRDQVRDLIEILFLEKLGAPSSIKNLRRGVGSASDVSMQAKIERDLLIDKLTATLDGLGSLQNGRIKGLLKNSLTENLPAMKNAFLMSLDIAVIAFRGIHWVTAPLLFVPEINSIWVEKLPDSLVEKILQDGVEPHLDELNAFLGGKVRADFFYSLFQKTWNTTAKSIMFIMLLNATAEQFGYSYFDVTAHITGESDTLKKNAQKSAEDFLKETGTPYDEKQVESGVSAINPTRLRAAYSP